MSGCGDDGMCDWRVPEEGEIELECERCGRKVRRDVPPNEQMAIIVWAEQFKGDAGRFVEFFAPIVRLRATARRLARQRQADLDTLCGEGEDE